jgi:Bacterial SH3 domain
MPGSAVQVRPPLPSRAALDGLGLQHIAGGAIVVVRACVRLHSPPEGLYHFCRMSASDSKPLTRPPEPARNQSRRASVASWGWRGLAAFWGSVAMAFGGGALVLQLLGPPSDGPAARRDTALPLEPRVPEASSDASPATAAEKPQDDVVGLLPQDRGPDPSSPEQSQVLSPAEVAQSGPVEELEGPFIPVAPPSAEPAASDDPPVIAAPQATAPPAEAPPQAPSPPPPLADAPAPSSEAHAPELPAAALPPPSVATGPASASTAGATERLPRVMVRQPANLRAGPDVQANVIPVVPRGETLPVHNRTANGWVQVGDGESRGWLHTSRLEEVE